MNLVAKALLESKSVHLEPNEENYFTWTSGRRSPIYCDNRQLISYPTYRSQIVNEFVSLIKKEFSDVEVIAGTATAGIPWAAWIADQLNLPMVYIRSKPKGHGLKTAIEGNFQAEQKVLIIEDLVSTAKSSIEAYHHVKNDKLITLGVLSIFTYNFPEANDKFKSENVVYKSLCTLENLVEYAKDSKLLDSNQCDNVLNWRNSF